MRFSTIVIVAAGLVASIAAAEPANMKGAGVRSCAQFATDYKKSPNIAEAMYFEWAQGFMSGLNVAHNADKTPLRDLDGIARVEQEGFIRTYCDSHPLKEYLWAVHALFFELPVLQ